MTIQVRRPGLAVALVSPNRDEGTLMEWPRHQRLQAVHLEPEGVIACGGLTPTD